MQAVRCTSQPAAKDGSANQIKSVFSRSCVEDWQSIQEMIPFEAGTKSGESLVVSAKGKAISMACKIP